MTNLKLNKEKKIKELKKVLNKVNKVLTNLGAGAAYAIKH